MTWETHPVTPDRFEDFTDVVNRTRLSGSRLIRPIEAHPVDPSGRTDGTMAFVGTRSMFERAGFEVVGRTDAVASGMPRLVIRRALG